MSDPAGLRDEAVVTLNELLYLNVGRHPDPLECALERDRAYGATATTLLRCESGSTRFSTTLSEQSSPYILARIR